MASETIFFRNETQGRVLVFRSDLCSGCGECIEICPQKFLRAAPTSKRSVGWKVKTFPEPEERFCVECALCIPSLQGGGQRPNAPWVLCPWRACTMCGECARICPDKAIYTLPLAAEEAPVSYGQLAFESPAVPYC